MERMLPRMRSTALTALAALVLAPTAGAWSWPASGPVLRPFSLGDNPYLGGQHRGIDVAGAAGETVVCAARRRRRLCRRDADERARGHDPNRRRLLRHADPSRVDLGQAERVGRGGCAGRDAGPVRHGRVASPVRPPRRPRGRRSERLPRPAAVPARPRCAGGRPAYAGRGRRAAPAREPHRTGARATGASALLPLPPPPPSPTRPARPSPCPSLLPHRCPLLPLLPLRPQQCRLRRHPPCLTHRAVPEAAALTVTGVPAARAPSAPTPARLRPGRAGSRRRARAVQDRPDSRRAGSACRTGGARVAEHLRTPCPRRRGVPAARRRSAPAHACADRAPPPRGSPGGEAATRQRSPAPAAPHARRDRLRPRLRGTAPAPATGLDGGDHATGRTYHFS